MFGMGGGGGSKGGAGNDVSAGALAALNSHGTEFSLPAYSPEAPNPALAPRAGTPQQSQGQPDQLDQMINKLLGVWVDRQKAQTQDVQPAPVAQPASAAPQAAGQQTQDAWGPYRVPIPPQYQHYFQSGEQPRG